MRGGLWSQGDDGMVTVILLVIYKWVMDILYIEYGVPIYGYIHFTADPNIEDAVIAWMVYGMILGLFRPVSMKPFVVWAFSEYVLFVLLLFAVVPGLSMCGGGAFPKEFMWWFFFYWLSFFAFARFLSAVSFHVPVLAGILSLRERHVFLYCTGMIVVVAVIVVFVGYGGKLFFSSLLSEDVYAVRETWATINMPFMLRYILANASIVLLFLIMCFLNAKLYLYAIFLLLVDVIHFSCGANKSVLLSAVICIFVYMVRKWLSSSVIILTLIGIMGLGMVLWNISGNVSIIALLSRNSFATNFLSFSYWDYFQTHTPLWDVFSDLPAEDKNMVPLIISDLYFGQSNYANNGLLGAAFMMAGEVGAVFSPIFWNMYLHIWNKAGNHMKAWMKFSLGISWAVTMMNSAMSTSILSHGGLALLILAYLSKAVIPAMQEKRDYSGKIMLGTERTFGGKDIK